MPTLNKNASKSPCNCTALRMVTRRVSQLYDEALAPTGLKITQRAILAQIGRMEPVNVGTLADALFMDSGALAHTLKPLERDGFIEIRPNPDDRRHRLIGLTGEGRSKLAESDALWKTAQASFEAAVGRAESKALHELLNTMLSESFTERFDRSMAKRQSR